jgi:hypothetical protein
MKLETAIKVLEKDAEFMGITFEQILVFITCNPYAVPQQVIEAYSVYQNYRNKELCAEQNCMVNV